MAPGTAGAGAAPFRHGLEPVYALAAEHGWMLPPGLFYVESWIDSRRLDRCFQCMTQPYPVATSCRDSRNRARK